jgi:hypothetical protein
VSFLYSTGDKTPEGRICKSTEVVIKTTLRPVGVALDTYDIVSDPGADDRKFESLHGCLGKSSNAVHCIKLF